MSIETKAATGIASVEAGQNLPAHAPAVLTLMAPADFACLAILVLVTTAAWCFATGKGISARWDMPTTYMDPVYSDFLGNCGHLRSLEDSSSMPFVWKTATDIGAPDGVNFNRTPTTDEALHLLLRLLGRVFGQFAGFTMGVLMGHLAAAATFYLVARRWLEATPIWSFVGALAFGLAPYLFAQSPHHVNCQYVWHVALFPMVWTWVATEPALQWRSRRWWQAIAVAIVTGLLSPYFTFIFCQLTLLGGAAFAWRTRSWKALVPAIAVVGAAAAAFFMSELDTLTYRLTDSTTAVGPLVAQREYRWMDIYGFKVIDMFIPSFTHHSETLANFGLAHRQASVLNDEEGCAYLGLLGIGCLLFLVATTVRALLDGKLASVPIQAWWVLWIVLFFNTGGLNSMVAAFTGFTLFRTATRYSVIILVIVLLYAVEQASVWQRKEKERQPADLLRIGTLTAAIAACMLVLWDQVPRGPTSEKTVVIEKMVESDRKFVGKLESILPDKAMVFQLPVMDGTAAPGVASHDHYRPYLYSTHLHWSHGALPGSKTLQWQQAVQQQLAQGAAIDQQSQQVRFDIANVRKAVNEMRSKGFAALYINRNGFPDRGKGLFDALLELGYETPPTYSDAGDLACVILDASAAAGK